MLKNEQRGRPKRRFTNVVKEDIQNVGVTEDDADGTEIWRTMICCGDSWKS